MAFHRIVAQRRSASERTKLRRKRLLVSRHASLEHARQAINAPNTRAEAATEAETAGGMNEVVNMMMLDISVDVCNVAIVVVVALVDAEV